MKWKYIQQKEFRGLENEVNLEMNKRLNRERDVVIVSRKLTIHISLNISSRDPPFSSLSPSNNGLEILLTYSTQ